MLQQLKYIFVINKIIMISGFIGSELGTSMAIILGNTEASMQVIKGNYLVPDRGGISP